MGHSWKQHHVIACFWKIMKSIFPRRSRQLQGDGLYTAVLITAISGDLLSAVISIRYILGFRKDNPNVFNSLIQNWLHF